MQIRVGSSDFMPLEVGDSALRSADGSSNVTKLLGDDMVDDFAYERE